MCVAAISLAIPKISHNVKKLSQTTSPPGGIGTKLAKTHLMGSACVCILGGSLVFRNNALAHRNYNTLGTEYAD